MKPGIWKPLDLASIEEGRFMELANDDLRALQNKLVAFVEEYGSDAQKATATMTITIRLQCLDVKTLSFGVKAGTKMSHPPRPASITLATAVEDETTGQPALFVRRSGGDSSDPRQGKLCTNKGETIDPETGEVLPVDGKSRAAGA